MKIREYTTYNSIKDKILAKGGFRGNSASGQLENGGIFAVKSYKQWIFRIYPTGKTEFNNKFYSVTTSRLQNLIARFYGLPTKRDNKIYIDR